MYELGTTNLRGDAFVKLVNESARDFGWNAQEIFTIDNHQRAVCALLMVVNLFVDNAQRLILYASTHAVVHTSTTNDRHKHETEHKT
jgi:hypothetical protein